MVTYRSKVIVSTKYGLSFFLKKNWNSPHTRLNSHYEAWGYKKRSTKRITGYRKSV